MTSCPAPLWILVALLPTMIACSNAPLPPVEDRVRALVAADRWWDALDELEACFDKAPEEPDAAMQLAYAHCLARCERGDDANPVVRNLLERGEVSSHELLEVCADLLDEEFQSTGRELLRTGAESFPSGADAFRAALRASTRSLDAYRFVPLAGDSPTDSPRLEPEEEPESSRKPVHWLDAPGPGYREMADPIWREIWLEE